MFMSKIKTCTECGVPLYVSKGQTWFNNGVIAETKNPDHRLLFFESDILDNLVDGIGEIIGVPIEHIVVESKRRATREYLEKMIPRIVLKTIYLLKPSITASKMADMAKAYGCGDIRLVDLHRGFGRRKQEDYIILTIQHPYSIYFGRGDLLGGMEASSGFECTETTTKIEGKEDMYRLDIRVGDHPPEFRERLPGKTRPHKGGNIQFKRCAKCGIPLNVAHYRWDIGRGMITDPVTGRRMALFTSSGVEAIFDELEAELGEDIPTAIIEAQRRYVRENFRDKEWRSGASGFEHMSTLRGLGMVAGFEVDDEHVSLTIENPCAPLLMVGIVQGLFELGTGAGKTSYTWSRSEDGDLSISVRKCL